MPKMSTGKQSCCLGILNINRIGRSLRFSQTPLHIACLRGGDEIVKYLLDAGADYEGRNLDGDCPSHLAVMVNIPKMKC